MDPLLIGMATLILIGLAFAVHVLLRGRRGGSGSVLDRARQIRDLGQHGQPRVEATAPRSRVSLPTVERYLAGANFTAHLLDALSRAGWRLKPSEYVGLAIGSVSIGTIVMTILFANPVGGLVGGVVGYAIPKFMLVSAAGRKKNALEAQIPDMVLLVSSALKSGYSFLKALQVVANEMAAPMADMARRVVEECQLGVPMEDALSRMAERVRSYDIDLVVTAVIIQSQVGGSLAEVLDSIAETIRERIQVQAEVSMLSAEGRISGIVLILMAPAMAVALTVINPTYIDVLVSDPMGIKMIIGAVVLQILGIVIIKRMMKIEV